MKRFLPANIELLDYMTMKQRTTAPHSQFFQSDSDSRCESFLISKDRKRKYAVISEGFIKTDTDLQSRDFDVNYSGTTVVSVLFAGNTLICANVGDSRAIIGSL